jgi:hypothetical protein
MRINGFRCDTCHKEHLINFNPARQYFYGEVLPSTWFIVARGGKQFGEEEPQIFCGVTCLRDYARKMSEVEP